MSEELSPKPKIVIEPNGVYDRYDAADFYGCSTRSVDRDVKRGNLKPFYLGGLVRFPGRELLRRAEAA